MSVVDGYTAAPGALTYAQAARIIRGALKDKSYRSSPLGLEVARYIRWKRNEWGATEETIRDYEAALAKLALFYQELELSAFEPPAGQELLRVCWQEIWGDRSPRTRGKILSVWRNFFDYQVEEGRMTGNPARAMKRPKKRKGSDRRVFSPEEELQIVSAQSSLRDRIAVALLFHTGMRKGALCGIRFRDFDFSRRRVTVTTKGSVVRSVPIIDPAIWDDLGRHMLERGERYDDGRADPDEFLLYPQKRGPVGHKVEVIWENRFKPMTSSVAHRWWYACLHRAGVVAEGETSGRRMHWARHTAGQRMLDATGNLKAVQKLLGHEDLATTADIYVDWDEEALIRSMQQVLLNRVEDE